MKKITALIGSAQRKATYQAVLELEQCLKEYSEVTFEIVFLSDYRLEFCRGCKLCFDKGEGFCPLRDDRDALLKKMEQSDGVIFASPSYAFQVSARMKNLLDRTAFLFHRPRFFGKVYTAIVTEGIPFGGKVLKYLESTGENMGFQVVKGCRAHTLEPMSDQQLAQMKQKMKKLAHRFHKSLIREKPPEPSFLRLMLFRFSRKGIQNAKVQYYDYHYFQKMGWFESDYYYQTKLGLIKKLFGRFFDFVGSRLFQ